MSVVGRLAPSPTGSLHVGNVRTFLWAWLSARSQGGKVILRVEDLDTPRVREGVVPKMIDDLRWLGFDWDGDVVVQSERREHYKSAFATLSGKTYPCRCTRGDIAAAQSAPHEGEVEPRYPGTCRNFKGPGIAWRLRVEPGAVDFEDRFFGPQSIDVAGTVGDFVVAKTPEQPAYQLAVVVDDLAQGVTEVVRGDDLIPSTARQILVHRALGLGSPIYGHVPLVVGTDGKRLAKRFGDAQIALLRAKGVSPERIIGVLADWSGLGAGDATPSCLVPRWSWDRVTRERVVLTSERLDALG
ncbi:MAG TPA: tRNA glutamyl-Q(34) synthetase GluQRS [Planctomycetota bacterium]|jgi:glutamyl-tRNA synthetase|nr:tRNA glutamyl-Q(34) synthetase GluQRS [Planctomycetota bacterium]